MLGVPDYQVEESGPDHQKSFRATVRVGGQALGAGQGRTKKAAEQQAAETAWRAITAESEGLPPKNGRENGDLRADKGDKGEPEH
jgi:ribonuclease-3